ncbi:MAG: ATP-binding protein [Thiohalomonadales bacterium]
MNYSIRLRLTLWYSLAMLVTLIIFSTISFNLVKRNLYSQVDKSLSASADKLFDAVSDGISRLAEIDRSGSIHYFRITQHGWIIYQSQSWDSLEIANIKIEKGTRNGTSMEVGTFRLHNTKKLFPMIEGAQAVTVSVAQNIDQLETSLQRLKRVFSWGLPLVFLTAISIGYFLAGRSLSPLRDITRKAKHINADRLDQRIAVKQPQDEIGDLAQALNLGFERLEQAFFRLQCFTADASHELRTPLAVIRNVGELGLQSKADTEAKNETISSMLEEVDRLEQLVENLLLLARADTGEPMQGKQQINIGELLTEVVECLGVLAEEKQQILILQNTSRVILDVHKDYLQRALFNVLDNAIRYTPEKGDIQVSLILKSTYFDICIRDSGPGIPIRESENIFKRFYRLDIARSRETGGSGLGLALARWGVEINGGQIFHQESSVGNGCEFIIRFEIGPAGHKL